jgi:putative peptidoglycan lipid II flippase
MENEYQQAPQPSTQGQIGQPEYNWQYDQEQPERISGSLGQQPAISLVPPQMLPNVPLPHSPVPATPGEQDSTQLRPRHTIPLSPRYQEPIRDMGTSLGYGQGMEYQFFNPPQPSQPMPQLRMERLQQLRQQRMQRDRQHNRPNLTSLLRRSTESPPLQLDSLQAATSVKSQPLLNPQGHSAPLVAVEATTVPASEPAQDTAAIQKLRVGRAAFILSGAFIASRVLGLVRQSMFTAIFGASIVSDAYYQAFIVPDTIFNIVAGGALSSAFIPVFTKYMVSDNDEKTAWHIADTALTLATALMVVLAVIAIIFAGPLVKSYNPIPPNYTHADYQLEINLITGLVRIMLWQAVILGSSVIVNSVLNARQNFLLPAIGTVLYNVGLIIGLIPGFYLAIRGHSPSNANLTFPVYCAGGGVVLGAALQLGIQIIGLKGVGMRYKPSFDWRHPAVHQIGKQMIPRIINAATFSFTTIVNRYLIGLLGVIAVGSALDGLKTEYYQAYQLVMLPLGIIGMAISTATFPTLAEYVSRGKWERVRTTILETLRGILFLSFPASAGLIILSLPVIQALLQHGLFSLDAAQTTAISLSCFAVGLAGFSAVEILTRAFYAMRDSKTPVIISIGQFIFDIMLSLLLLDPFSLLGGVSWGMGSLALGTGLASIGEALVLFIILDQRIGGLFQRSLLTFIGRALLATAGMSGGILVVRLILDVIFNTTNPHSANFLASGTLGIVAKFLKLAIELLVGTFLYLRLARLLNIEELGPIRRVLSRFKLSWMV